MKQYSGHQGLPKWWQRNMHDVLGIENRDVLIVFILEMCEDNAWNVTINTRSNCVAIDTGKQVFEHEDISRNLTLEDLLMKACVDAIASARTVVENSKWENIYGDHVEVVCEAPGLNTSSMPEADYLSTLQELECFGNYEINDNDCNGEEPPAQLCKQNGSWVYHSECKNNLGDRVFYRCGNKLCAMLKKDFFGIVGSEYLQCEGLFRFRQLT